MKFLSSINSYEFTTIAFVIGYLLCDNLTPAEQNSIGNWFMLVGQVLSTNASQQQVINNANKTSNNSNTHIVNDNNLDSNYDLESLKRAVNIINQKLNNL
jgi:hypothetical protein